MIIVPRRTLVPASTLVDTGAPYERTASLNDGLLGWWIALPQAGGGLVWRDLVQSNHMLLQTAASATTTSGLTRVTTRRGGFGEVRLNGTTDYGVGTTLPPSYNTTQGTISCWINMRAGTPGYGAAPFLFDDGQGTGATVLAITVAPDGITFGADDEFGGVARWTFTATPTFALGVWHHVVLSGGLQGIWFMVDGVLRAMTFTVSNAGNHAWTADNWTGIRNVRLGYSGYYWQNYVNGRIDDIRLYNRQLSPQEMQQLYLASLAGYPQELRRVSLPSTRPTGIVVPSATGVSSAAAVRFTSSLRSVTESRSANAVLRLSSAVSSGTSRQQATAAPLILTVAPPVMRPAVVRVSSASALDVGTVIERNAPLNDGLLGWWVMLPHSAGGTQWRDVVHRNDFDVSTLTRPASPTSGMTRVTRRRGGLGEARLNGATNYATRAPVPGAYNTTQGTLSVWANRTATNVNGSTVFSLSDGSLDGGTQVAVSWPDAGNSLLVMLWNLSVSPYQVIQAQTAAQFPLGSWYHLVWTGGPAGNALYVNGVRQTLTYSYGSATTTAWLSQIFSQLVSVDVGRLNSGHYPNYLTGLLDDVRLYNRQLSPGEVAELYQNSQLGYPQELRRLVVPVAAGPPPNPVTAQATSQAIAQFLAQSTRAASAGSRAQLTLRDPGTLAGANQGYLFGPQQTWFVPAAAHGMGHPRLRVQLYDNSVPRNRLEGDIRVDPVTADVTVQWLTPQAGLLVINGYGPPPGLLGNQIYTFAASTTWTIPGPLHRYGTPELLVDVYDNGTPPTWLPHAVVSVHPATFTVTVSHLTPQAGSVVLCGYGATGAPNIGVTLSTNPQTIPGSTHNLQTAALGAQVYDPNGRTVTPGTVTVHPTTYDVTVGFAALQPGTVVLNGSIYQPLMSLQATMRGIGSVQSSSVRPSTGTRQAHAVVVSGGGRTGSGMRSAAPAVLASSLQARTLARHAGSTLQTSSLRQSLATETAGVTVQGSSGQTGTGTRRAVALLGQQGNLHGGQLLRSASASRVGSSVRPAVGAVQTATTRFTTSLQLVRQVIRTAHGVAQSLAQYLAASGTRHSTGLAAVLTQGNLPAPSSRRTAFALIRASNAESATGLRQAHPVLVSATLQAQAALSHALASLRLSAQAARLLTHTATALQAASSVEHAPVSSAGQAVPAIALQPRTNAVREQATGVGSPMHQVVAIFAVGQSQQTQVASSLRTGSGVGYAQRQAAVLSAFLSVTLRQQMQGAVAVTFALQPGAGVVNGQAVFVRLPLMSLPLRGQAVWQAEASSLVTLASEGVAHARQRQTRQVVLTGAQVHTTVRHIVHAPHPDQYDLTRIEYPTEIVYLYPNGRIARVVRKNVMPHIRWYRR